MLVGKDTYQVIKNFTFTEDDLKSLILLYQPLIGKDAIQLYLTLALQYPFTSHTQLTELLNQNIHDVESCRIACEEFRLIRSFKKEVEETSINQYQYLLLRPLTIQQFLNDGVFSRLLSKKLDEDKINFLESLIQQQNVDKNYQDVTSQLDMNILTNWDNQAETKYQQFKQQAISRSIFDMKALLSKISELNLPQKLRTMENLAEINRIGQLYGIPIDTMIVYLSEVVDYFEQKIDLKALEFKARNCTTFDNKKMENPYLLSCVQFLKERCHVLATPYDKHLIHILSTQYQMKHYMINVLLEHALEKNGNLNRKYLESIASRWSHQKIDTIEIALESLKSFKKKYTKESISMEYQDQEKEFDFSEVKK